MTGCSHPNTKDSQADKGQRKQEGDEIASHLVVEVPSQIGAQRSPQSVFYGKCCYDAAKRRAIEEVAHNAGVDGTQASLTEAIEECEGIEHPGRGSISHKQKEQQAQ